VDEYCSVDDERNKRNDRLSPSRLSTKLRHHHHYSLISVAMDILAMVHTAASDFMYRAAHRPIPIVWKSVTS
jgi:hypothetical protein